MKVEKLEHGWTEYVDPFGDGEETYLFVATIPCGLPTKPHGRTSNPADVGLYQLSDWLASRKLVMDTPILTTASMAHTSLLVYFCHSDCLGRP